jgi:dihydrofolate synthase/folylpolyglutamate synthase
MTFKEAVEYIYSLPHGKVVLGLGRIKNLLKYLGDPQDKIATIHIAGTNGKGSTTKIIHSVLKNNYKVGMNTSPHLKNVRERFVINDSMIEEKVFADYVSRIKKIVENFPEELIPSFFEFVTSMAFLYFYEKKVDFAIMEVGLGGRLDGSNVISKPLLSIITHIDLDHTTILGDTIEKIAYEKAGIIKDNSIVVLGDEKEEVKQVILNVCNRRNSRPFFYNHDFGYYNSNLSFNNNTFDYKSIFGSFKNLFLNLNGIHQFKNASTAIFSLQTINARGIKITEEDIRKGLKNCVWEGRFEGYDNIIIDGAHNIDGAKHLAESLKIYFPEERFLTFCGILGDKAYEKMLDYFSSFSEKIILTRVPNPRSNDLEPLKKSLKSLGVNFEIVDDYKKAYDKFRKELFKSGKKGIVSGSLYLIGALKAYDSSITRNS